MTPTYDPMSGGFYGNGGYYDPANPYVAQPVTTNTTTTGNTTPPVNVDPVGNYNYNYGSSEYGYGEGGGGDCGHVRTEPKKTDPEEEEKRRLERLNSVLEALYDLVKKMDKTETDTKDIERLRQEYETLTGQKKPGFMP